MPWLALSGLVALFYGLHGAWSRHLLRRGEPPAIVVWATFVFGAPAAALSLLWEGAPAEIQPAFLGALAVSLVINLVAMTLLMRALAEGKLSIVYPLLSLTPLAIVATEWSYYRMLPSRLGALGVALMAGGVYALHLESRTHHWFGPLRSLAQKPSRYALAVALLWSVSSVADKVATQASSPAMYITLFNVLFALLYLPAALRARRRSAPRGNEAPGASRTQRLGMLLLLGALWGVMALLQMHAITLTNVSYVIATKRSGALVAVLFGSLAFREGALASRLAGALLMTAGVWCLAWA
ncbi:MAG: EamA family transporter [Acidobacteriota bacterium]|nr:MAG: EamA family transporter [Acidobacteriota bacterium]